MTKQRIFLFLGLLVTFLFSFCFLMYDLVRADTPRALYRISVIVRGKNSDSWAAIKQGADQAADEMYVDLSFITLGEQNNVEEQKRLIEREISAGADAILLSAADSKALSGLISQIAPRTPVVCIESSVESSQIATYVSGDNFEMGRLLGEEVLRGPSGKRRVALLESSIHCAHILERRAGLMSVLETTDLEVESWTLPDNAEEAVRALQENLSKKQVDTVVALDFLALEQAAQVIDQSQAYYITLFGIGSTDRIAYYLEQDLISATVIQNDFGIGYLGIKSAVDVLEQRAVPPRTPVEYLVITPAVMYLPENQRLLFPFIR